MGDAAAERPAPRDPRAALDEARAAARRPHSRRDHVWIAKYLCGCGFGEIRREQAARGGDRYAPASRCIPARDRLRAAQGPRRRGFQRTERSRHPRAHQARRTQRLDESLGQGTCPLGLAGQVSSERAGAADQRIQIAPIVRAGGEGGRRARCGRPGGDGRRLSPQPRRPQPGRRGAAGAQSTYVGSDTANPTRKDVLR